MLNIFGLIHEYVIQRRGGFIPGLFIFHHTDLTYNCWMYWPLNDSYQVYLAIGNSAAWLQSLQFLFICPECLSSVPPLFILHAIFKAWLKLPSEKPSVNNPTMLLSITHSTLNKNHVNIAFILKLYFIYDIKSSKN